MLYKIEKFIENWFEVGCGVFLAIIGIITTFLIVAIMCLLVYGLYLAILYLQTLV